MEHFKKINIKEIYCAWITFILGLFTIYFLFIKCDFVTELDQKITFIIASFGILFSGIQFWMGSIRGKKEFIKTMRYEEYKRTRELINRFFNYLSDNMGEENDIHLLDRQLVSVKNELAVIIQTTNNSIFKGIKDVEEVKKFGIVSDEIITLTDKLRYDIDKYNQQRKKVGQTIDFTIEVKIMNWHNDIRENIKELHELKYHMLKFMEEKIIE